MTDFVSLFLLLSQLIVELQIFLYICLLFQAQFGYPFSQIAEGVK